MRTPVLFLARAGLAQSCTGLRRLPSRSGEPQWKEPAATFCSCSRRTVRSKGPRASLCGDHPRGSGSACGVSRVPTRTTYKPQESLPAVPDRGSTACKGRTCADRRAGVRTACNGCAGATRTWASCCPWRCWMFWPSFPLSLGSPGFKPWAAVMLSFASNLQPPSPEAGRKT